MPRLAHVAVVTTVAVAAGGIAHGSEPPAPEQVHACVGESGLLRIVETHGACRKTEKPLSWAKTGAPAQRWFEDRDGDGFGDWYSFIDSPVQVQGYVANNDDCNDDHPGVNPNGSNGNTRWDYDCDGVANEADTWWYPDRDGDGLGDFDTRFRADNPAGAVRRAGDCDDGDAAVTTQCRGFDYWYRWSEEQQQHIRQHTADFDGDGHYPIEEFDGEIMGDDCDDYEPKVYPGNDETRYDGLDNDCDPATLDVEPYVPDVGRHDPVAWGMRLPYAP